MSGGAEQMIEAPNASKIPIGSVSERAERTTS
jgi:hypothetical protein